MFGDKLDSLVDNLKEKADTLRVKANLAGKDAQDEVQDIESKFASIKEELFNKFEGATEEAKAEWQKIEDKITSFKSEMSEKGDEAKDNISEKFEKLTSDLKDDFDKYKEKFLNLK